MKKKLIVLLSICMIVFFGSPAVAADHDVSLSVSGTQYDFYLNMVGPGVLSLNGMAHASKNIALTGSVVVEGSYARFGYMLCNAMEGYSAVVQEFVINISTLTGSGNYQWLVGPENEGLLSIGPWTAESEASPDTEASGR